ncbi:protease inhibitor Kazal-type [Tunicatimonas pelagia]|uniref:protease inhibitor Kazal-type n=1 Tax=Tunicatimonas pelagia TaxID=931531 RepID=UPI00266531CF|nr:protease inhibitor Kazal-type [Tunicatimonas pelagia]WKN43225.1 protease inhibitor Kazal-type [Tunicatimonas pelagia]
MKKIALLLLLSIHFLSCEEEDRFCQETKDGSGACYDVYRPVCGCNGKTYGNDCVAESFGITEYTSGECE